MPTGLLRTRFESYLRVESPATLTIQGEKFPALFCSRMVVHGEPSKLLYGKLLRLQRIFRPYKSAPHATQAEGLPAVLRPSGALSG